MTSGTPNRGGESPPTSDDVVDGALASVLNDLADTIHSAREAAVDRGHDIGDSDADPLCPEEEEAVDAVESQGFELLGVGAARIAFTLPNSDEYVVKFARYGDDNLTDGQTHNYRERMLYDLDGEDYPLLPVVDADDDSRWLIMPRVDQLADDPHAIDDNPEVVALIDELAELAKSLHTPEINPQNVGYYEGEPHLFDYGRPPVDY